MPAAVELRSRRSSCCNEDMDMDMDMDSDGLSNEWPGERSGDSGVAAGPPSWLSDDTDEPAGAEADG